MGRLMFRAECGGPQSLAPLQDGDQLRIRAYLDESAQTLVLARLSGREQAYAGLVAQRDRPDFWSAVAVDDIMDGVLPARASRTFSTTPETEPFIIEVRAGLVEHHLRNDLLPAFGGDVLVYACDDPLES